MKPVRANKNVHYDARHDVLYFGLKKGQEEEFSEIAPGISVEFDENGHALGIEILNASKVLKPISRHLWKHGFASREYSPVA